MHQRLLPLLFLSAVTMCAEDSAAETYKQLAREILADLVAVNTGVTTGSTAPAGSCWLRV